MHMYEETLSRKGSKLEEIKTSTLHEALFMVRVMGQLYLSDGLARNDIGEMSMLGCFQAPACQFSQFSRGPSRTSDNGRQEQKVSILSEKHKKVQTVTPPRE